MKYSQRLIEAIQFAESFALNSRLEFITPELLLVGICCRTKEFETLCDSYMVDYQKDLKDPIYATLTEHVPEDIEEYELQASIQLVEMITIAEDHAAKAGKKELDIPHVLHAMLQLKESQANYLLRSLFTDNEGELMRNIIDAYEGRELPKQDPRSLNADDSYDDNMDYFFGPSNKPKWTELVVCVFCSMDRAEMQKWCKWCVL